MSNGVKLIRKMVRVREHLLRSGASQVPKGQILPHLLKLKKWVEFYPNASDEGVRKFLRNNLTALMAITPGKGAPNHEAFMKEINGFIYGDLPAK